MTPSARSVTGALIAVAALSPLVAAQSDICYDGFGRPYRCYSGLSNGARIGIGIGIAAAFILLFALCGMWRRKQLQKQFSRYRPPALPYAQNNMGGNNMGYSYGQGNNPYANNPPPPTGYQGQQSSFANSNPYGNNPQPPNATYQPSMAGQYGYGSGFNKDARGVDGNNNTGNNDHEHGYEWEQAREAERLEREQAAGGHAPPGYDVSTAATTPVVTGNGSGNDSFAPPPGAPPSKR